MSHHARLLAARLAAGLAVLGSQPALAAPQGDDAATEAAPRPEDEGPAEDTTPGTALDVRGLRSRSRRAVRETAEDDGTLSKRTDRPWIKRWAPERGMLELGVFGGLLVPAHTLELFEPRPNRPAQGFVPLQRPAPEVGARVGYYPLRALGIEVEGAYARARTRGDGYEAPVFAARGHIVGQLPFASITPFAVFGAGALGLRGHPLVIGTDVDPAFHLGGGVKFFFDRRIALRLDLRDVISPRRGIDGGATNSFEATLGLSVTLGRERDRDEPEPQPEPETPPPSDRDSDGFLDGDDRCPDEAGVAPDGCPAPSDRDADGFVDESDACPDEAGIAPDGCPDRDADQDGIDVPDDQCPDEPEEYNSYEDEDGCPDQVPDEVQRFNGRLEGVNFDLGKARITPESLPILDEAVAVLEKHPKVRIEISGHTDNTGSREINMRLSLWRANAVRDYMVAVGIDASRIETRGAGPDEPIDSNATAEGRANNRRIEFRVLN